MRIDSNTVAQLLGREMHFASPDEVAGIEMAVGSIRSHLHHTQPFVFNADKFDAAYQHGVDGNAFKPIPQGSRADLPPKPVGMLTEPDRLDKAMQFLVKRLRATLKRRENARVKAYNRANGIKKK